jgi:DNA repair protein RecO
MNRETSIISAIILDSRPFKDNDLQVNVYSKEKGKIALRMRGALKAKSKLIGQVQPFSLSTLMIVHGKNIEYIGGAKNIDPHLNIRENLNKLTLIGKSFFIFNGLILYNQTDNSLFKFLKDFLDFLEDKKLFINKNSFFLYQLAFILKLLKRQGYRLNLYNCVFHKKKIKENPLGYYFNFNRSGVCCQELDKKDDNLKINSNVLKILRFLEEKSFKEVEKIIILKSDLKLSVDLVRKYLLYHFSNNFFSEEDKELVGLFSH